MWQALRGLGKKKSVSGAVPVLSVSPRGERGGATYHSRFSRGQRASAVLNVGGDVAVPHVERGPGWQGGVLGVSGSERSATEGRPGQEHGAGVNGGASGDGRFNMAARQEPVMVEVGGGGGWCTYCCPF